MERLSYVLKKRTESADLISFGRSIQSLRASGFYMGGHNDILDLAKLHFALGLSAWVLLEEEKDRFLPLKFPSGYYVIMCCCKDLKITFQFPQNGIYRQVTLDAHVADNTSFK